jgi:ribonuclease VapC
MFRELRGRGLKFVPYTEEDALTSTLLDLELAKPGTLSLGDRACLVFGLKLKLPIYTADRLWNRLGLAVDLRLIR